MDSLEISVKTNNEENNTIFMMTEDRKNCKNVLFISLLTHKGYLFGIFPTKHFTDFEKLNLVKFDCDGFVKEFFLKLWQTSKYKLINPSKCRCAQASSPQTTLIK